MSGFKTRTQVNENIVAMKRRGMTFAEISKEIHMPVGTIKTHYYLSTGQPTARVPESPYPRYDDPPEIEGDALIIPDAEIPFHHAEFLNRVLDLADKWQIKKLIWAGDAVHFDSLSGWEPNWTVKGNSGLTETDEKRLLDIALTLPKNYQQKMVDAITDIGGFVEERGFSGEMLYARKTLAAVNECFDDITWLLGNHECLDEETEVFADGEWKKHTELIPGKSKVLVFNDGVITEETITDLHIYDYSGPMYLTKTMLADFMVSPNHNILWHPQEGGWRFNSAKQLFDNDKRTRVYLPLAGKSNRNGCALSDDEIRIAGWIYTDCTINKRTGYYQFSQRKSKHKHITDILDRLKIEYSLYERERNTKQICGKELLKQPEAEVTISVLARDTNWLRSIVGDKEAIADWAWKLDDRQFDIFLYAFIDGDGSIHKSSNNSLMIYCNREKLAGQLQTLCILHGYRATISRYNGDNIRINITKHDTLTLDNGYSTHTTIVNYTGKIWCVTVPSSNFLVRRTGRPVFTGNSRLMRTINSPLEPNELLNLMNLENGRWQIAPYYYCWLNSDGVRYRICHPKSAGKGAAEQLASKFLTNILMGHSHLLRHDWDKSGQFYAIQMGHCVDEKLLAYASQRDTVRDSHKLGAVIIREGYPYLLHEHINWKRMEQMA